MKSNLIKEFLLIWIMVIFFILESTYSPAQESPKSLTILYTNNINGELEPCPS